MFDDHLIEADFKLLGDQRGHRGVSALAHLHRLDGQEHPAFAVDAHVGVGREGLLLRLGATHQYRQGKTDQQPTAQRRPGLEKTPAAYTVDGGRLIQ